MLPYKLRSLFLISLAVVILIIAQDPSNTSTGSSNITGEGNVQKTRGRSRGVFPRIPSALVRDEGPGSRPGLSTAGTLSPVSSVILWPSHYG
jgi:hypothetical protein